MKKTRKHRSGSHAKRTRNQNQSRPVPPSDQAPSHEGPPGEASLSEAASSQISSADLSEGKMSSPKISSGDPPSKSTHTEVRHPGKKQDVFFNTRIPKSEVLLPAAGIVLCLLIILYFNARMAGTFPGESLSANTSKSRSAADSSVTTEENTAQDPSPLPENTAQTQESAAENPSGHPEQSNSNDAAGTSLPDAAVNEEDREEADPESPEYEEEYEEDAEYYEEETEYEEDEEYEEEAEYEDEEFEEEGYVTELDENE